VRGEDDPSPRAFRLRGFLPHQLNVLANRTSEGFSAIYSARFGLSVPEWRILATLGEAVSARAKDIEGTRHMHKTVVSRAVATLRERGLVEAQPNEKDKRESFLALTEEGRRLYEEIVPLGRAFEDDFLAVIDADERIALERIMAKLMVRPEDMGK
jgi:DNA-binding MarR family transcriptional regulator